MTLAFFDGFEEYPTDVTFGFPGSRWTPTNSFGAWPQVKATPKTGTRALGLRGRTECYRTIRDGVPNAMFFGGAYRYSTNSADTGRSDAGFGIINQTDGVVLRLTMDPTTKQFEVWRNQSRPLSNLGLGTENSYFVVMMYLVPGNPNDTLRIQINGTMIYEGDFPSICGNLIDSKSMRMMCGGNGDNTNNFTCFADNVFAFHTVSSLEADALFSYQELIVYYGEPVADGAVQQWTANGQPTGWECVEGLPPSGDYVSGSTSQVAEFELSNPLAGTAVAGIFGLKNSMYADKSDSGVSTVEMGLSVGGTPSVGSSVNLIENVGTYYEDLYEENPISSAPWTSANLDSYQFVMERTA